MKKIFVSLFAASLLFAGSAVAGAEDDVRAVFDRFVAAQNAHDVSAVRDVLLDSPTFLWITRGTPVWGRDAALKRFETLYLGTWKLAPDVANLKIVMLTDTTAHVFIPIIFNIGPTGQPAPDTLFLMNQTLVKTSAGWRIATILPILVPPPAPAASK